MENPIGYYTKATGSPVLKPANKMTRYDQIKNMRIEEMAAQIINLLITDAYCKSDCGNEECTENMELECCVKWLMEEVKEKAAQ